MIRAGRFRSHALISLNKKLFTHSYDTESKGINCKEMLLIVLNCMTKTKMLRVGRESKGICQWKVNNVHASRSKICTYYDNENEGSSKDVM